MCFQWGTQGRCRGRRRWHGEIEGILVADDTIKEPQLQVPALTSQVYPLGQQWVWSVQHVALGRAQQPYEPASSQQPCRQAAAHKPSDSWQHVFPAGHSEALPGQTTLAR